MLFPELPLDPPEAAYSHEVQRLDWEYATPQAREAVAIETIMFLTECAVYLQFLDKSDPEDVDNFRSAEGPSGARREFDAFEALERIKKLVAEYQKNKVLPFLDKED